MYESKQIICEILFRSIKSCCALKTEAETSLSGLNNRAANAFPERTVINANVEG